MMNVARLDVFCQVGFLGSNIGHSGHFALVRKIGQKKNWSEEKLVRGKIGQKKNWSEKKLVWQLPGVGRRCKQGALNQDEHHFTMIIWGLRGPGSHIMGSNSVFFSRNPNNYLFCSPSSSSSDMSIVFSADGD